MCVCVCVCVCVCPYMCNITQCKTLSRLVHLIQCINSVKTNPAKTNHGNIQSRSLGPSFDQFLRKRNGHKTTRLEARQNWTIMSKS